MPGTTITRSSDQKNAFFIVKIKGHPNRNFWHGGKKKEKEKPPISFESDY